MYINTDAVAVSLNRINIVYFVNLFTMVNMLLNQTFHAEFFDFNNLVIKFIVTDFHDAPNAFSHVILL